MATTTTAGTKYDETTSASRWIGATATRFGYHANDLGEHRFAPDPLGLHHQRARAVDCAANQLVAGSFLDGDRLAGDHRLVHGTRAFHYHTVDGNLLAGTDSQPIARNDLIKQHVLFSSILADPASRPGGQPEQRTNGTARLVAGSRTASTWPSKTSVTITAAGSK